MKLPIYNLAGKQVGEREINSAVFGVTAEPNLIQQLVVAESANARQVLAHTLTRSEVRGGGKKPWKQKGTGRARHGSIRSPLWRGGGVTFGPRSDRNFSLTIPSKMKRKALLMALSDKVANNKLVVLDDLTLTGKTKEFVTGTTSLWQVLSPARLKPSVLLMLPTLSTEVKRATGNVPKVSAVRVDSLQVSAVLGSEMALTTVAGLEAMEAWLGASKK